MSPFENEYEAESSKTTPEPEYAPELPDLEDDFILDEGEPIKARKTGGL